MNWDVITFDWNQVRAFLVTAEEGSLSAASRALGQSQPTISRQVSALESALDITLFERVGRRLVLTGAGLELLEHVRAMGEAAQRVALSASGQGESVEGHVVITATDTLAMRLLPPALAQIRKQAPGVTVEIVASNENRDLLRREADIAIRHGAPTQPDLIAKRLPDTPMALYGASPYLDTLGRPETAAALCARAAFVGFERTGLFLHRLQEIGLPVTQSNFPLITENGAVTWSLVTAGLALALLPMEVAESEPALERALPAMAPLPIPLWLITHRELKTNRRIRLTFDALVEHLSQRPTLKTLSVT